MRADDPPGVLHAVLVAHHHGGAEADRPQRPGASSTMTAVGDLLAQPRDLRLQMRLLVLGVVVLAVLLQIAPFASGLDALGDLAPALALELPEFGVQAPLVPRR